MNKCLVCGGEVQEDTGYDHPLPIWITNDQGKPEVIVAENLPICKECYDASVILHALMNGDEVSSVVFEPFPANFKVRGLALHSYASADNAFDRDWWMELISNEDGEIDPDKVMAELEDFSMLISNTMKAFWSVTNGNISKPNTSFWEVSAAVDDIIDGYVNEAIKRAKLT